MTELLECLREDVSPDLQLGGDVFQVGRRAFTLHLDGAEAIADLGLRDGAVGREIDQALFFLVEFLEALLDLGM
ncbi:hypothetical protein [Tsukamurella sp. PLM1]|uniref:hypothetical protein n=1 Tax=Tsukamurella sp. PLM1 TaxID=2929795 RepID=UPI0020C013E1|nr:hypothetical protein [Tsukamurella sp. PLM1]